MLVSGSAAGADDTTPNTAAAPAAIPAFTARTLDAYHVSLIRAYTASLCDMAPLAKPPVSYQAAPVRRMDPGEFAQRMASPSSGWGVSSGKVNTLSVWPDSLLTILRSANLDGPAAVPFESVQW